MVSKTPEMKVPFNKPVKLAQHEKYVLEAMANGQIGGNGAFTKKCEQLLEKQISKPLRIVTSATHALEVMALLINIQPGDEVIVPSFTFVSTANAFALRGAKIRFADNDEYGNIRLSEVERLLTAKTKAVAIVHYAGASADMDRLLEICATRSVAVLEDAAQAVGATYKGRALGVIGTLGCYSFHDTKNITSGEGGAVIFGNEKLVDRAEILREKGTNRSRFLQGLVDKYTWVDVGSSYVLSELNSAYLYPQIEAIGAINGRRKEICDDYIRELESDLSRRDIKVLRTPAYNTPNYHMMALTFPNGDERNSFMAHMKSFSITCPFHYVPLHNSPFGATFYSGRPEVLPGAENLSQRLIRLPLYYNMTPDEQGYVIDKARLWLSK